ncbi:MAG: tetratricopeptide repeat protein [Candidatus Symbiobacter sp.]|nr:tetratricopeptide repeat protein [Candidatus Symbiobacter sp.]
MLFDPWILRARALLNAGLYDDARNLIHNLIDERGRETALLQELSGIEKNTGNHAAAIALAREVLANTPPDSDQYPQAYFDLAYYLYEGKYLAEAKTMLEQILAKSGDKGHEDTGARFLMAQIYMLERDFLQANPILLRLVKESPDNLDFRLNLGNSFHLMGAYSTAAEEFRHIIERDPDHCDGLAALGYALVKDGQAASGIEFLRRANQIAPSRPEIGAHLAEAMNTAGQHQEALTVLLEQEDYRGNSCEYWMQRAATLRHLNQIAAAVAGYKHALEIEPTNFIANNNLALIYINLGDVEKSESYLNAARANINQSDYAPVVYSNAIYNAQYLPDQTATGLREMHLGYNQALITKPAAPPWHFPNPRDPDRPLRVGYVSHDFMNHPVGFFVSSVIGRHDRRQVESFCYNTRQREDNITKIIRAGAHNWRQIHDFNDTALEQLIRQDAIDVLVDLSGHTADNKLPVFARKPAPVQVTWAGYVGTTGLATMDWLLADRYHVPPELDELHAERVYRMPHDYICYEPPSNMVTVAALPALQNGYVTFGCFNNPVKINRSIMAVWARIMHQVPNSRLFLRYGQVGEPESVARITDFFAAQGIPSHRLRIENGGTAIYMYQGYNEMDIALDTQPYSGGLTTCEAMWMGVPVVTCPSTRFASRHSYSHLTNVGLGEMVGQNFDDYVQIAVALAHDLGRLSAIRTSLRARMAASPLCDSDQFTLDLEAAWRFMWREYCATLSPQSG